LENQIRVLLLSYKGEKDRLVEKSLSRSGFDAVIYPAPWQTPLEEVVEKTRPDIAIVSFTPEEKTLPSSVVKLIQQHPHLPVSLPPESFPGIEAANFLKQGISDIVLNRDHSRFASSIPEAIRGKQMEKKAEIKTENLMRRNQPQEGLLAGVIYLLNQTIAMYNQSLAQHQQQVAKIARSLARQMRVPEQPVYWAGLVHDIGMLSVPTEIINKPGSLTDEEKLLVKQHPEASYKILKQIDFPWPIAEIVLQHHERLDGSGYPRHLKGEQILLEAKILAVADVVQAMSSHRPHRPSLKLKPALGEITEKKGKLYEPRVVDACLALFRGHY